MRAALHVEAGPSCAAPPYHQLVPKAKINRAAMQTVIDLRIELGVYPPPHEPPERFYDTSYWCEATGLSD